MSEHTARLAVPAASPERRVILASVLLWAIGVAMIRVLAPTGWLTGTLSWLVLPATLPVAWLTLRLATHVAGRSMDVVTLAALACAPALLLDGVGFSCVPGLYGPAEDGRRAAAGWLLWFVGAILALAFRQAAREKTAQPGVR